MQSNFSILMSLYYKESPQALERCLISLKNQTLQASEIILVLDGMVGNALNEVIEKWKSLLPLFLIQLPQNVGLGKALNIGLKACRNDIVARMDTDDECFCDRFEIQLKAMNDDSELVLIGSSIIEYDSNMSAETGVRDVPLTNRDIIKTSKVKNPFNHMTVMFRKNAIVSSGGYKHHIYMEDYNLWLRLISNSYKMMNINKPLVKVRCGKAMINRRRGLTYIKSEWKLFLLKKNIGLQGILSGFIIFMMRSIPRVLPLFILKIIYASIRK